MPDYFDRLLARHVPAAAPAAGEGRPVSVRPRLPGPYERVEALGTDPPLLDEPTPLVPTAPARPAAADAVPIRHERAVESVRHSVVRTEPAPSAEPDRRAADAWRHRDSLLRPAAPVAAGPRPAAPESPRTERRAAAPAGPEAAPDSAAPTLIPPAASTGPATPDAASRPGAAGPDALRRAATQASAGRRGSLPAEQVVHVQIGRLEVSAAGGAGGGRSPGARSERTERRGPALSLEDYLSRGSRGSRAEKGD